MRLNSGSRAPGSFTTKKLYPFLAVSLVFVGLSALFLFRTWDVSRQETKLLQTAKTLPKASHLHYWTLTRQIEHTPEFTWPRPSTERYLCWNSWKAGFNNERISLELAISLALIWNRTLVLPPHYRHYNLNQFSYEEFWEIEDIKQLLPVLTYEQFRKVEPSLGADYAEMEKRGLVLSWKDISHFDGVVAFPRAPDQKTEPEAYNRFYKYATKKRHQIVHTYDNTPGLEKSRIVYFPAHTLFAPFFAFVYTLDPALDQYIRRSVRDNVHLKTEIFDAAQIIISALPEGFSTLHIRRGDFQYQDQRHLTGAKIFANVQKLLTPNSPVYIASDESASDGFYDEFVKVFEDNGHKVYTYQDFAELLSNKIPQTWIGPVEQVICSRGVVFVGTKLSTYTGYINRLRGYMLDIDNKNIYFTDTAFPEGYENTRIFPKEWPTWNDFWIYHGMWGMEYKESWTDLD